MDTRACSSLPGGATNYPRPSGLQHNREPLLVELLAVRGLLRETYAVIDQLEDLIDGPTPSAPVKDPGR